MFVNNYWDWRQVHWPRKMFAGQETEPFCSYHNPSINFEPDSKVRRGGRGSTGGGSPSLSEDVVRSSNSGGVIAIWLGGVKEGCGEYSCDWMPGMTAWRVEGDWSAYERPGARWGSKRTLEAASDEVLDSWDVVGGNPLEEIKVANDTEPTSDNVIKVGLSEFCDFCFRVAWRSSAESESPSAPFPACIQPCPRCFLEILDLSLRMSLPEFREPEMFPRMRAKYVFTVPR